VLTNAGEADRERKDPDAYLDGSAELVWEVLLKPVREKLPDEQQKYARMSYGGEISNKPTRGREYSLNLGAVTGAVEFYIAESRLYVLLAAYPAGGASEAKRFFDSFKLDPNLPGSLSVVVPKIGAGVVEAANPSSEQQILRSGEVTERARVLEKPEPSYTESARKFSVTGTVVLRAVFSKDGEVTNISIIRRLPHGLTEKAINAARMIKFRPAMKDGQPVSMWMQLEYNFNLY
jgi:TonB family protein